MSTVGYVNGTNRTPADVHVGLRFIDAHRRFAAACQRYETHDAEAKRLRAAMLEHPADDIARRKWLDELARRELAEEDRHSAAVEIDCLEKMVEIASALKEELAR